MATLFPFRTAEDTTGARVASAKLYFYLEGTTTDATVYQDAELTTPHVQPVVASLNGEFAAIYMNDTVSYRAMLKSADGVTTYWDYDPASPSRGLTPEIEQKFADMAASAEIAVDAAAEARAAVEQISLDNDEDYLPLTGGTLSGSVTISKAGGDPASFTNSGEGGVQVASQRYSNDASAPSVAMGKARGTIATPSTAQANDILGNLTFNGYAASFITGVSVRGKVVAATPSASDMESEMDIRICAAGSATVTEILKLRHSTGLSLFSNVVIDQNRIFRPRSYTLATLPSVTATGIIFCSDLGGGGGLLISDGTSWRRLGDGWSGTAADSNYSWANLTDGNIFRHSATLTAARDLTLTNTNIYGGARVRVYRTGGGAFNLNVKNNAGSTLKALATNTWADFVYSSTGLAYELSGYGAL